MLSNAVDAYDVSFPTRLPVLAARYGEAVDSMEDVVDGVRASGIGDELRAFAADVRKRSVAEFAGVLAVVREDARRLGRTFDDLLQETLVPGVEAATATLAHVAEQSVFAVASVALAPFADFAANAASALSPLVPALLRIVTPIRALGPAASELGRSAAGADVRRSGRRRRRHRLIAQAEAQDAIAHAEAIVAEVGAAGAEAQAAVARARKPWCGPSWPDSQRKSWRPCRAKTSDQAR